MEYFKGLDVSVERHRYASSVRTIVSAGNLSRHSPGRPDSGAEELGLRPGADQPGSGAAVAWLDGGLAEAGLPAICIETRHAKAFLKAQGNKTDRNDARGMA
jgi:transposase